IPDLVGFLAERSEVLAGTPALGDQLVGGREAPAAEPNPDPAVDAPEVAVALRARTGRTRAHRLDLLEAVAALPADVLVDRHIHRVSTAPRTDGRRVIPTGEIPWGELQRRSYRSWVAPMNPSAIEPSPVHSHLLSAWPGGIS